MYVPRRTASARRPIGLILLSLLLALLGFPPAGSATAAGAAAVSSAELNGGWALRSADEVGDTGPVISQPGYGTAGWHPVTLPSTVMAALTADGTYKDVFFGQNLKNVPDLTTRDWWYRGEFTAPAAAAGQAYWLRFKGVSYRAQIWLNGTQLDANAVGTMTEHAYNAGALIRPGQTNALAIRVTPPAHACKDLSFCTVDWSPEAPDMGAGLWGKTLLETTGPVALRDPYVKTDLPLPDTSTADLTVYVDALNATAAPVTTTVAATISKPGQTTVTVSQNVTLAAGERREVAFTPASYPQLRLSSPVLWWPHEFGSPELYGLTATASVAGAVSDTRGIDFGVREITDSRTTVQGTSFSRYQVNGKDFFFRGGGYAWDMFQRWDTKTNTAHVRYAKDMGLNVIRLEGNVGNEELYDIADREGMLLWPGLVCCSAWEDDQGWSAEQEQVARASVETQMRASRHHASSMMWAHGSDQPPTAAHLAAYQAIADRLHWQNPVNNNVATWADPNAGMKMDGPYKWEPPVLWWDTTKAGSAFGTTGEEGTEGPPPAESLAKFLAPADQWPLGTAFDYHAGKSGSVFDNIDVYDAGLNGRHGTAGSLADYSKKSELMNYETTRSFFEAWSSHRFSQAFGTIFWMQSTAWPSTHWSLYDYYLKPGGSYFGAKKANRPVHLTYDYATRAVTAVNSTLAARSGLTATTTVYNIPDLSQKFTRTVPVGGAANAAAVVDTLPALTGLSATYFIRLQLKDASGAVVDDNLYWYSTRPDVLGKRSTWYMTAVKTYADLTGLNSLPANSQVATSVSRTAGGGTETATIRLTNNSTTAIGFFLRPEITAGDGGSEVLPVNYSDNYVSLFPGESTTVTARYDTADLGGKAPYLRLRGYNIPTSSVPVP
ncbi:hypothetical protein AB0M28_09250 [Streptomyces sp. NPDC051940]|uniref:glycoside hydrolase family 2 protein n=1 Tax=Streptomyces sp. NPDC051940 TaxID=3155675 RepID=UPI00344302E3